MKRFKIISSCCAFCVLPLGLLGFSPADSKYEDTHRVFHIERSVNKNIVCYDLNLNDEGMVNGKEPLQVYWENREKHPGKRNGIKYFQQPAYGYKVTNANNNTVLVKLNAIKNRTITIEQNNEHQYVCTTNINGQAAILQKIYVKTCDNNPLQVEYVDVYGIVSVNGVPVTERIKP